MHMLLFLKRSSSASNRVYYGFFLFLLLIGGSSSLFSQEKIQSETSLIAPRVAPKKKSISSQKKSEKESPITPDGSLTKAYQSKRPWEMLSPFAPPSYGNGEEMVSENPDELGKENGLIIFGIEW